MKLRISRSILLILLLALLLRLLGVQFGLPYDRFHPTENFGIERAVRYLAQFRFDPGDYRHPTLFQYLLYLVYLFFFGLLRVLGAVATTEEFQALFRSDPTIFYLLARLMSVLASALTVWVLYLLGKRMFDPKTGLASAVFLGVSFLAVQYAHYAVPDSVMLFFLALTYLHAFSLMRQARMKDYLLTGLFSGLALSSKFPGVLAFFVFFLAHTLYVFKKPLAEKMRASKGLICGLLLSLIVFVLICPYHVLNFQEAFIDIKNDLIRQSGIPDSQLVTGLPFNLKRCAWFSYIFIHLQEKMGPLFLLFVLAGVIYLFFFKKTRSRSLASMLVLPSFLYLAFIGGARTPGLPRHLLPILPLLILLASQGIEALGNLITATRRKIAVAFMIILVATPPLFKSICFDISMWIEDTRSCAANWIEANIPKGALIAFEPYTPGTSTSSWVSGLEREYKFFIVTPTLGLYDISYYKERQIEYLVVSSFRYNQYFEIYRDTGLISESLNNYLSFERDGKLLKTFYPPVSALTWSTQLYWQTWPHFPVIKIYEIKGKGHHSF